MSSLLLDAAGRRRSPAALPKFHAGRRTTMGCAHAVEMAREGVPLIVIQGQLGHTTSASRPSTSRESTAPRSSTLCTPAAPHNPVSAEPGPPRSGAG